MLTFMIWVIFFAAVVNLMKAVNEEQANAEKRHQEQLRQTAQEDSEHG